METPMTSLISLKSKCIKALENYIQNCRELLETNKDTDEMNDCFMLCHLCIDACVDCINACESVQANSSQFMQIYVDICNACIANFENHVQVEFKKSASAHKDCIAEYEHIKA